MMPVSAVPGPGLSGPRSVSWLRSGGAWFFGPRRSGSAQVTCTRCGAGVTCSEAVAPLVTAALDGRHQCIDLAALCAS